MRWLTLNVPGEPGRELFLQKPGAPMHDDATAEHLRELVSKGALFGFIMSTDDCRSTYGTLKDRGIEFTQEPTEQTYGIDCALRDPFGNHIRIAQPAPRA